MITKQEKINKLLRKIQENEDSVKVSHAISELTILVVDAISSLQVENERLKIQIAQLQQKIDKLTNK